jgi:large subunit ribosomal protein L15
MSFVRRLPKPRVQQRELPHLYHIVNLKTLEARMDDGAEITAEVLAGAGVIRDTTLPLKVLGEGDLTKKFTVTAAKFSEAAKKKIEAAGGTVNEVPKVKWTRQDAPSKPQEKQSLRPAPKDDAPAEADSNE